MLFFKREHVFLSKSSVWEIFVKDVDNMRILHTTVFCVNDLYKGIIRIDVLMLSVLKICGYLCTLRTHRVFRLFEYCPNEDRPEMHKRPDISFHYYFAYICK